MNKPKLASDQRGRKHRKLRISLTDRCNFRCPYCMPEKPQWLPNNQLLSSQELRRIAAIFVRQLGIRSIRLTGGEPLLRPELPAIIQALNALRPHGLQRISLTTNATRLAALAKDLQAAGLDDLNISLDSLKPEQFRQLSRGRHGPADVTAGIQAALQAGLPVKLNCVIIRDYNHDQILPLLAFAHEQGVELRFIEFMPLDDEKLWSPERVITADHILKTVRAQHSVEALPTDDAPAQRYQLDNGQQFGIIATVSQPFCQRCDRLRISADGQLFTCLFEEHGTLIRGLKDDADLERAIRTAVLKKPGGYIEKPGYRERGVTMYQLGG